ncbi:MAG TPA: hypothetical protein VMS65_13305, partial [Polyangiaceae bacterium]|nr:hypothetical protein [Polyangiaceae bacterium]
MKRQQPGGLRFARLYSLVAALAVTAQVHAAEAEGTASDAQPGLYRVGLAEPTEPAIATTVGYGFTEAQGGSDGGHHRLSLRLAGAAAVLPWLNVGPVIDGRYDKHPNDSGGLFEGGLVVRGVATASDFRLGVELKPWLPSAQDLSTSLKAISLDSRLLGGAKLGSATIAASAGYRLDRGAEAAQGA